MLPYPSETLQDQRDNNTSEAGATGSNKEPRFPNSRETQKKRERERERCTVPPRVRLGLRNTIKTSTSIMTRSRAPPPGPREISEKKHAFLLHARNSAVLEQKEDRVFVVCFHTHPPKHHHPTRERGPRRSTLFPQSFVFHAAPCTGTASLQRGPTSPHSAAGRAASPTGAPNEAPF